MSHPLTVRSLSKAFGGVQAIDDLSFDVHEGSVHAVIGPNGGGKTTLINLLSGVYVPDAGAFSLFGEPAQGALPEALARRGISRTFQNLQVCMNLGALENVRIGAHLQLNTGLLAGLLRSPWLQREEAACRARARELMVFVGIAQYTDAHASQLPYGALKRLEIARAGGVAAAAADGRAGCRPEPHRNRGDRQPDPQRRRRRHDDHAVEHDMKLVMDVSDRILVLNHGRRLALGTTDEVRAHPEVISAYLGETA